MSRTSSSQKCYSGEINSVCGRANTTLESRVWHGMPDYTEYRRRRSQKTIINRLFIEIECTPRSNRSEIVALTSSVVHCKTRGPVLNFSWVFFNKRSYRKAVKCSEITRAANAYKRVWVNWNSTSVSSPIRNFMYTKSFTFSRLKTVT